MFLVWSRVGRWFEFDTREGILDPGSDEQVQKAAENGDVNELRRLRELGRQLTAQTCAGSAENGNLECLQYLHENGCQWDERTCAYAARCCFECLQYAHENGCPWDEETCSHAAFSGILQCLRYAHDHGCPWDARVFECATQNRNLEILQFARDHGLEGEGDIRLASRRQLRGADLNFIPEETQQILAAVDESREAMPNETYREIAEMLVEVAQCVRDHGLEGESVNPKREEVIGFLRGKARRILAAVDEVKETMTDQAYRTVADGLQRIYGTI